MHRARTDFEIEGSLEEAASRAPEILEGQDQRLKGNGRHARRAF
jgi:hypothetical protein